MEQQNKTQSRRLFIALVIPEDVKSKLLDLRDSVPLKENYPWEVKDKLHITLCFLGDVAEDKLPSIENLINQLSRFKKIACKINKFGFFGRPNNPNILYAAVNADKKLNFILHFLTKNLGNLDIYTGTPRYKQHVTLLRIKQKLEEGFVESFSDFHFEKISFIASEIVLYESSLLQTGSIYKRLKTIYLP